MPCAVVSMHGPSPSGCTSGFLCNLARNTQTATQNGAITAMKRVVQTLRSLLCRWGVFLVLGDSPESASQARGCFASAKANCSDSPRAMRVQQRKELR